MPQQREMMRCGNCGTEWRPRDPLEYNKDKEAFTYTCPVCQFQVTTDSITRRRQLSLNDLETQLGKLLTNARSSGIPGGQIVEVLKRELEFTAELAYGGRRILVHLIDIGPPEIEGHVTTVGERFEILHGRGHSG